MINYQLILVNLIYSIWTLLNFNKLSDSNYFQPYSRLVYFVICIFFIIISFYMNITNKSNKYFRRIRGIPIRSCYETDCAAVYLKSVLLSAGLGQPFHLGRPLETFVHLLLSVWLVRCV